MFILSPNLFDVIMKLDEAVLLTSSPGVKRESKEVAHHPQRAEAMAVIPEAPNLPPL